MKRILTIGFTTVAVIIAGLLAYGYFTSEKKPQGFKGPQAEEMADKMMDAVNVDAWDTTGAVQWRFMGAHDFVWDKKRDFVEVKWKENRVLLHTRTVTGLAYKNGELIVGEEANKMVQSAWSHFCNDSFWFNAVVKVKDPGTERSIVKLKDGREGLMVEYTSGGVTPGDTYVWLLDDNYRPTSYKMWVQVMPIGGIEVSWDGWIQLSTGAWIAQSRGMGKLDIEIDNIKGAADLEQLTKVDIFKPLTDRS